MDELDEGTKVNTYLVFAKLLYLPGLLFPLNHRFYHCAICIQRILERARLRQADFEKENNISITGDLARMFVDYFVLRCVIIPCIVYRMNSILKYVLFSIYNARTGPTDEEANLPERKCSRVAW